MTSPPPQPLSGDAFWSPIPGAPVTGGSTAYRPPELPSETPPSRHWWKLALGALAMLVLTSIGLASVVTHYDSPGSSRPNAATGPTAPPTETGRLDDVAAAFRADGIAGLCLRESTDPVMYSCVDEWMVRQVRWQDVDGRPVAFQIQLWVDRSDTVSLGQLLRPLVDAGVLTEADRDKINQTVRDAHGAHRRMRLAWGVGFVGFESGNAALRLSLTRSGAHPVDVDPVSLGGRGSEATAAATGAATLECSTENDPPMLYRTCRSGEDALYLDDLRGQLINLELHQDDGGSLRPAFAAAVHTFSDRDTAAFDAWFVPGRGNGFYVHLGHRMLQCDPTLDHCVVSTPYWSGAF